MRMKAISFAIMVAAALFATGEAMAQSTPAPTPSPAPIPPPPPKVPPNAFDINRFDGGSLIRPDIMRAALADRAAAQRIYETPSLHAQSVVWATAVADCMVEQDGDRAGRLVASSQYDSLARAANTRYRYCLLQKASEDGVELKNASLETLNGALAETLLKHDGITYEDRAPLVDVNEAERFSGVVPGARIDLDMVGRCVAVYSPGIVQQVLETTPGSAEEAAELEALYRQTPECGLGGRPDSIPASLQRLSVAKGLYLWVNRG